MLRVHFTGADLARTRFVPTPDPLWEAVLSPHQLRQRTPDADLVTWQRATRSVLGSPACRPGLDRLFWLVPLQHTATLAANQERHAEAMERGGVGDLFAGLTPLFRWRWPVLEAPYPLDKDVHLAGRGLLLVPSYFCRRMPVTFADPGLPPVLVYPITTVDTEPDKSGELRGPAAEPDRGLARPDADGNGS